MKNFIYNIIALWTLCLLIVLDLLGVDAEVDDDY